MLYKKIEQQLFTIFAILVGLYCSVVFLFFCGAISINIDLFIYSSIYRSIYLPIYLSVYIYIHTYIHYPYLRRKCGWGLMILISVGRTPPNI